MLAFFLFLVTRSIHPWSDLITASSHITRARSSRASAWLVATRWIALSKTALSAEPCRGTVRFSCMITSSCCRNDRMASFFSLLQRVKSIANSASAAAGAEQPPGRSAAASFPDLPRRATGTCDGSLSPVFPNPVSSSPVTSTLWGLTTDGNAPMSGSSSESAASITPLSAHRLERSSSEKSFRHLTDGHRSSVTVRTGATSELLFKPSRGRLHRRGASGATSVRWRAQGCEQEARCWAIMVQA